ncbi:MAG: DNA polymerase IV, partial [Betaproteobacteria bacterium]|nr:DNA polymerase IV [Betaproteobacteria bacterium]
TIAVKLRYEDFRIITRAVSVPGTALDARTIRRAAGQCLKKFPLERKLRLIGVRADRLCRPDEPVAGNESGIRSGEGQLALPLAN